MNKKYIKSSIWVIVISAILVITMLGAMGIGRYSISLFNKNAQAELKFFVGIVLNTDNSEDILIFIKSTIIK